jgi:hypothetical protein
MSGARSYVGWHVRRYIELAKRQVRYVLGLPIWALPIVVVAQMIVIATVSVVGIFLEELTLGTKAQLGMILILSPVWLHTVPAFWLAGILVCEWMWMITGLYRLFGIRPNSIRRSFEPTL